MLLSEARIQEGLRVYAIGDIHGCIKQLSALLNLIDHDLETAPVDEYKIIFLGDYVDRGPSSAAVLDCLIELKFGSRNTVFLLGNHDERFANFVREPSLVGEGFLHWGGIQTIESYGVEIGAGAEMDYLHLELSRNLPSSHLSFLDELEVMHIESDFVFVHAGIRPKVKLKHQHPHDLVWIRRDFLDYKKPFKKIVVHGHTPVKAPELLTNRINVDTGCVYGGKLTAVVLENGTQRIIQA